jgi:hypothetical protein
VRFPIFEPRVSLRIGRLEEASSQEREYFGSSSSTSCTGRSDVQAWRALIHPFFGDLLPGKEIELDVPEIIPSLTTIQLGVLTLIIWRRSRLAAYVSLHESTVCYRYLSLWKGAEEAGQLIELHHPTANAFVEQCGEENVRYSLLKGRASFGSLWFVGGGWDEHAQMQILNCTEMEGKSYQCYDQIQDNRALYQAGPTDQCSIKDTLILTANGYL